MSAPAFQRIEELFHHAAALAPPDRSAFLDAACAGDAALRAAVEELLRHDCEDKATELFLVSPLAGEAERQRLETPTLPDLVPMPATLARPPLPAIPGYELLEELARGGMGVVYKARQVRLNRLVALKMLLPASAAALEPLARFRIEAEALARLHHPNIVSIYDIGEHEGRPYFAMEFVAGPSLAQWLAGRPQEAHASAHLIEVVARTIHVVHERGVIHRDLKPANILLAPNVGVVSDGRLGIADFIPKITDFGLAKDQTAGRKLTQSGTAMGTPCYMAPEQVRTTGTGVGPAADIYALGAILYEMLTGRPPFDAETPAETMAQLLYDEPPSPSRLRPKLPRDLVTICSKCLEKSAHRRYTTALDVAEDLRRFQAGEPIRARPVGLLQRSYRWCRRRPLVAGLLGLSGILALAFVITVLVYNSRLNEALAQAEATSENRRLQIVRLNINIGVTEWETGDSFTAVLHFTEALRLDQGNPEKERNHRTRIATALRQSPRLCRLLTLERSVFCADMNAGRGYVATVGPQHEVDVWDVLRNRLVASGLKHAEPPRSGAFSADGRWLATVTSKGALLLWDLPAGKSRELPVQNNEVVQRLVFHANSRLLVSEHGKAMVQLWDVTTCEPVPLQGFADHDVTFSALSENGQWLFTCDASHIGQVWDLGIAKTITAPLKLGHGVSLGAVSSDGRRLALLGPGPTLTVWDVYARKMLNKPLSLAKDVTQVGFSPSGQRIVTVGSDFTVHLWNTETGQLLRSIVHAENPVTHAHFSPDDRMLLTNHGGGGARLWDADTGLPVCPPLRHGGNLTWAGRIVEHQQVVTVSNHGMVCIWDLPRLPQVTKNSPDEGGLGSAEKKTGSGARQRIKLGSGMTVQVSQATTGALRPPRAGGQDVEHAVLSPDGRSVVVCDDNTTARIWDVAAGEPRTPPLRHRGAVLYAAFSPDGKRLMTASDDKTVRVWDVITGEVVAISVQHAAAIERVYFSANGDQAWLVHEGGGVSTWDLSPDPRPVATLMALAQVHACGHIDEQQQACQTLSAAELRRAWDSLQSANTP
jgi:serine/threonine protein kinase/WD40 repeat protein